jgi:hypothetical protein
VCIPDGDAQIGEDGVVVLAECGDGAHREFHVAEGHRGQDGADVAGLRVDGAPAVAFGEWRVASGPAAACSRATTVTPARGSSTLRCSEERRARVRHRR